MILRIVSMNEDSTEYFEEDIGRDEMESAFLEFQNGEDRILIGYADGSKTVINADYVQAMHLESDLNAVQDEEELNGAYKWYKKGIFV